MFNRVKLNPFIEFIFKKKQCYYNEKLFWKTCKIILKNNTSVKNKSGVCAPNTGHSERFNKLIQVRLDLRIDDIKNVNFRSNLNNK